MRKGMIKTMNTKPYIKPEMEITEFDTEDVITTSDPEETETIPQNSTG